VGGESQELFVAFLFLQGLQSDDILVSGFLAGNYFKASPSSGRKTESPSLT
jgi:hypothetical protein